ncbi:MAG: hypothetical protein LBF12_07535 [Christensenellaceae bacterium]|nr:hypothetical protein [Christensenellaceae bacterium]
MLKLIKKVDGYYEGTFDNQDGYSTPESRNIWGSRNDAILITKLIKQDAMVRGCFAI